MVKRGIFNSVLIFALAVALGHSFIYLAMYGLGVPGFEGGISGLSVKNISATEEPNKVQEKSSIFSTIAVIAEWVFVIFMFLIMTAKRKVLVRQEAAEVKAKKDSIISAGNKTDIDKLYEILKEKKKVGILAVAQAFNIDKELVLEWGQTLEDGGLAIVEYPRIGEPQIVLNENVQKTSLVKNEK